MRVSEEFSSLEEERKTRRRRTRRVKSVILPLQINSIVKFITDIISGLLLLLDFPLRIFCNHPSGETVSIGDVGGGSWYLFCCFVLLVVFYGVVGIIDCGNEVVLPRL